MNSPITALQDGVLPRRDFLAAAAALAASGSVATPAALADAEGDGPEPTAAQAAWMRLRFGLFVHFGINTYYDTEWSDGTLDAARFNPTRLDTDQWAGRAADAGMKYLVLVAKHHDGFCNWPTAETEYSVKATPYRGDIVGEVARSCEKHGLKLGLYYSLWDRREPLHDADEPAYAAFVQRQLNELLTGYGPVVELWFDGMWKKQQSGWRKKLDGEASADSRTMRDGAFIEAWRAEGAFRWQIDHLYQCIKQQQPDCLVMNNSTSAYPGVPLHPVDVRSGEKATSLAADRKVWKWLGKDRYFPLQIETTLSQEGRTQFRSGSWFWHNWDHSVATKEQILGWRANAERLKANLLLNAGPSPEGRLRPEDDQALRSLAG